MYEGGNILRKLWCCLSGEYNKIILLYSWWYKLSTVYNFKAVVLSVSPLQEQMCHPDEGLTLKWQLWNSLWWPINVINYVVGPNYLKKMVFNPLRRFREVSSDWVVLRNSLHLNLQPWDFLRGGHTIFVSGMGGLDGRALWVLNNKLICNVQQELFFFQCIRFWRI